MKIDQSSSLKINMITIITYYFLDQRIQRIRIGGERIEIRDENRKFERFVNDVKLISTTLSGMMFA